ncbi:hypothetical protein ACHAQJ_009457 [Trichoderma viride]
MMGGLGRTRSGTYAEYTVARISKIVEIGSLGEELPISWEHVAALPISYGSAWTCLFRNLDLQKGQRILVRAATSAFGRAAIELANRAGATVTATTRTASRFEDLKATGASEVVLEGPGLAERIEHDGGAIFDCVLELLGNTTFRESLTLNKRGGRMCLAGFLRGQEPVIDFEPIFQILTGAQFSEMIRDIADGTLNVKPARIFSFEDVK